MRDLFDEEIMDVEDFEDVRKRYSFRCTNEKGSSYQSEGHRAFDPSELESMDVRIKWLNGG